MIQKNKDYYYERKPYIIKLGLLKIWYSCKNRQIDKIENANTPVRTHIMKKVTFKPLRKRWNCFIN